MEERKRIVVENKDNGGRTTMWSDIFENFSAEYRYVEDYVPDPIEEAVEAPAKNDIHQMNKPALIALGKELGVKVTNKMSVGKLKEAIEDYNNSSEDITEI